jgi:hypothetical protein
LGLPPHCLERLDGQLDAPFVVAGVADEDLIQQVGYRERKERSLRIENNELTREKKIKISS